MEVSLSFLTRIKSKKEGMNLNNYGFRLMKSAIVRLKKKEERVRRMPVVRYYLCELPRAKASRLPASTTDSIPLTGYGGLISTGLTSLRPVGTTNDGDTIESEYAPCLQVCVLSLQLLLISSSYHLYNVRATPRCT